MIRLLIADDHEVVRRGIRQAFEDSPEIRVTGEAQSAFEVLELLRGAEFDVVLLDLSMPGKSGLELLAKLKQIYSALPVLILSVYPEELYAVKALKGGAAGYLTKNVTAQELATAIKRAYAGKKYVSSRFGERLVRDVARGTAGASEPAALSRREREVVEMIARGRRLKDIADELSLSIKTVSTYKTRIIEKMHFRNDAELIQYALESMRPQETQLPHRRRP